MTSETNNTVSPDVHIDASDDADTITVSLSKREKNDWAAIRALAEKARAEQAQNLKHTRMRLRADLMYLGVTAVTGEYNGYADSGNTDYVSVVPSTIEIDNDIEEQLNDFIWDMAYQQSPGFEINEGAFGTLEWDVTNDKIAIEHNER